MTGGDPTMIHDARDHHGPAVAPPPVPWLKPGVVMHDPAFPVDELLADFALEIRSRGFSVKGFVQRNNRPGEGCAPRIELQDLSDGSLVHLDRRPAPETAASGRRRRPCARPCGSRPTSSSSAASPPWNGRPARWATRCGTGCRPAFRC